jgi:hypothetical protein
MASNKAHKTLEAAKTLLRDSGLEKQFLESTGLSTLDEFSPQNFVDPYPSQPTASTQSTLSAALVPAKDQDKSVADAHQRQAPMVASDVLLPYARVHVTYAPRKKLSTYCPSALVMDYIVHLINDNLVDNFYFKRSAPDYHPYILRLYFAVVFWIQCLRAGHDVRALDVSKHQFLVRFLEAHPAESLAIPGPLLPLFKTLCSSQPENPLYGKVYPKLPEFVGPDRRSDFIRNEPQAFILPNVPGILALLSDLNSLISTDPPTQVKKGKHIPVTSNANQPKSFGFHTFPVPDERSNQEKWSLCSSGLQYPCEADLRLNADFAERYDDFDFPALAANDCLLELDQFMSMESSMAWFAQVKSVAATAASYFEGSGTLADCSPHGIVSNQLVVELNAPPTPPPAPTCNADKASTFPFSFRLSTSMRSPPALAEAMASMAQTNILMFNTHPYLAQIGRTTLTGGFWDIRPIDRSTSDASTYLTLGDSIKRMMKAKV